MKYTIEMQPHLDIDWFAVDADGYIIHFASGGGELPNSVAESKEDTQKVAKYFRSYTDLGGNVSISPYLDEVVKFSNQKERNRYLNDFILMSKKGLYSFDKSVPSDFLDKNYHLVAIPDNCLKLNDLPSGIASIIAKTKINSKVEDIYKLRITNDIS